MKKKKLPNNLGPYVILQDEEKLLENFIIDGSRGKIWIIDYDIKIFNLLKSMKIFPKDMVYNIMEDWTKFYKEKNIIILVCKYFEGGITHFEIINNQNINEKIAKENFQHLKEALNLDIIKTNGLLEKVKKEPYLNWEDLIINEIIKENQ